MVFVFLAPVVSYYVSALIKIGHTVAFTYLCQKLITARDIFLLSEICFMRFDFINFDFGLDYTAKATFGKCSDKFSVDIPTAVGHDPPSICGKNNGYHSELNWTYIIIN